MSIALFILLSISATVSNAQIEGRILKDNILLKGFFADMGDWLEWVTYTALSLIDSDTNSFCEYPNYYCSKLILQVGANSAVTCYTYARVDVSGVSVHGLNDVICNPSFYSCNLEDCSDLQQYYNETNIVIQTGNTRVGMRQISASQTASLCFIGEYCVVVKNQTMLALVV